MTPVERINAAAAAIRAKLPPMFIAEEPDKFAPGDVVVEDGKPRRMMVEKIIASFAQCLWFDAQEIEPHSYNGAVHNKCTFTRHEIVHTSMLTLDKDQQWFTETRP